MKQRFSFLAAGLLALLLILLPRQAEAAAASLSGPGTLRAGNTVTLTLQINAEAVYAVDTGLKYDTASLELLSFKPLPGSWKMDQKTGGGFLLEDPTLSNPASGSTRLFSLTFRAKSSVAAGSTVSVTVSSIKATGEDNAVSLGSASWSATVQPPLSGDATLKSLSCAGTDLTFTGGTEYRLSVPYETTTLKVGATPSHSGAKVSVSGNHLSVGSNTVTVTVTAENGTVKRYYLYVSRAQDPNYVPGSDATLSALTPSSGALSPAFHPDITEYVLYLPYEVTELTFSAAANDPKAQSLRLPGKPLLPEGETVCTVTCTAEDGTTRDYVIHVIRMPRYEGVLPEILAPTAKPTEPEPEAEPSTYDISLPLMLTLPLAGEVTLQRAALGAVISLGVLLLLLLLIVWLLGRRSGHRKAMRKMMAPPSVEPSVSVEEVPASALTEEAPEEAPAAPVSQPTETMSLDDILDDIRKM